MALLADHAEESAPAALAAGGAAALSVYAYTSCRILPVALALHFAIRLARAKEGRPRIVRAAILATGAGLVVSVPNLVLLARSPSEVLRRGAYVIPSSPDEAVRNLLATVFLPFHLADAYRGVWGPMYAVDGLNVSFTLAGFEPVDIVVALASILGAVLLRKRLGAAATFLLGSYVVSLFALGPTGPSLTRLLILLPVLLSLASVGAGAIASRGRAAAALVAIVEFFFRPLDPSEIPLSIFHPDVVLVARRPPFRDWAESFGPRTSREVNGLYWKIDTAPAAGRVP